MSISSLREFPSHLWSRWSFVFCLLLIVVSALGISREANAQGGPATVGQWSSVQTWPYRAVSAAVLPNGKVFFFDSFTKGDNPQIWDPATNTVTPATKAGFNIFCTGHSFLPDGRLFLAGGDITDNTGLPYASIYNPVTNSWTRLPDMNAGRWYPTTTTLANGDVLVVAGMVDTTVGTNLLPQVWQTASSTWRDLNSAQLQLPYYPYMFLAPNGKVFNAGPNQTTRYLTTSGNGSWATVGNLRYGARNWGSAVLYDDGKVLMVGGTTCAPYDESCTFAPTATAEVIDLNAPSPSWQYVASMAYPRKQHNATVLPDGKVLVLGGTTGSAFDSSAYGALTPEMWNPATNSWAAMASNSIYRGYHSTALLLPDGRVLSAGGEASDSGVTAEVYSPPYLFNGTRPTITSAPTSVGFGQTFFVGTPDATSINKVTLIALSAVTHTNNMGQRISQLSLSQTTGGLNVTAPSNANLTPPGYYMLFILNGNGVPSVAKIIRVDAAPVSAPSAPSGLAGTGVSNSQVNLSWTDSSNNEDGFRIERCQGSGCSNFAEIAAVGPNIVNYSNTGLSASTTYRYRARAYNSGGNSGYSNTADATTTAPSPPSAPSGLTATAASSSQINLSWTDNSSNETGFKIERKTGIAGTYAEIGTVAGNGVSYNNTGLTSGTTYYYRVRATNGSGDSAYSNEANATTTQAGIFPTTTVLDNFNRSNSGPPPSASWAGPIQPSHPQLAVITNSCAPVAAEGQDYWSGASFGPDQEAHTRVPGFNNSYVGLWLRLSNPNASNLTGYVVHFYKAGHATNTIRVFRLDSASTSTKLGTDITQTINDGDSIGASIVGNTITVYYKVGAGSWSSLGVRTDNTYTSTGRIGLEIGSGSVDDFGGGTLVAGGTTPAAPSALTATAASSTQINLAWTDNSNNETGFKIERCQGAGCSNFAEIATVAANAVSYQNTGLTAGTTYQYRVRASNTAGDSAYSNTASATTLSLPAAPSALTATAASSTQINLAWTDNSNNETGFRIERCQGAGCSNFAEIATVAANVVSYQNTGLTAGTTYQYRVRASNTVGDSAYSNTASATTLSLPAAPSALTATAASSTQINLAWTDNSNNETGFKIERCQGAGCSNFAEIATVAANVVSYQNTGLTAGTTYQYRVRAFNTVGDSAYSNTASATTTTVVIAPAAPSGLTATAVSSTQINLAWTDNSNNETGFKIERCQGAGCSNFAEIATVAANVVTYQNTGLTAGTTYQYRVRASNTAGDSAYSNTASATTTTVVIAPAAPSGLTATAVSSTQINLTWTDNSNNEDGFRIERSIDNLIFVEIGTVGANTTSYSDTLLPVPATYYYRVRAYNSGGNSAYSNTASATTAVQQAPVPASPTGLTATAVSSSRINLAWTDNANNEDGFKIERSTDNLVFTEIATVNPNVTTYANTGLVVATTYYYRVRAFNAGGNSGYSNTASATLILLVLTPPSAPSGLSAAAVSSSQINLSWSDNSSNESGFQIERSLDNIVFTQIATAAANQRTYSDSGLVVATTYFYRVRAYNTAGTSGYSNTASTSAGCTFPCNGILDNFDRANQGPPPSGSWGGNIVSSGGGLRVINNQLGGVFSDTNTSYWNTAFGPDTESYITLSSLGSTYGGGLWFRVSAPNQSNLSGYLVFAYNSLEVIRIFRRDSTGSYVQLGADIPQTVSNGDSLGVTMIGSTITIYYKVGASPWTNLSTRTDSNYLGGGFIGVETAEPITLLDNFGGGNR